MLTIVGFAQPDPPTLRPQTAITPSLLAAPTPLAY
jgi:hypothetical protein